MSALTFIAALLTATSATVLCAQVRIPMLGSDVPFTLQTLAVLLTGFCLRPVLAFGAMALYLAVGSVWPVAFASPAGLGGPTTGYLIGFLAAAPLVSVLSGRLNGGFVRKLVAASVGMAIIFALGVTWKAALTGWDFPLAIKLGFIPFVPEAILKTGLALAAIQTVASVRRIARSY